MSLLDFASDPIQGISHAVVDIRSRRSPRQLAPCCAGSSPARAAFRLAHRMSSSVDPRREGKGRMPVLPARTGVAVPVATGSRLSVINTYGQQVVDTWIINQRDPDRFVSTAMTWMRTGRLHLHVGDELVDTSRTPIARMVEDTSPGRHDMLIPSCDSARYRELGVSGHHDNCHDNFFEATDALGMWRLPIVPAPINLFMNVPIDASGVIEISPPVSGPGDRVTIEALKDVVFVLSACPQDIAPTNGDAAVPRDVEYLITE